MTKYSAAGSRSTKLFLLFLFIMAHVGLLKGTGSKSVAAELAVALNNSSSTESQANSTSISNTVVQFPDPNPADQHDDQLITAPSHSPVKHGRTSGRDRRDILMFMPQGASRHPDEAFCNNPRRFCRKNCQRTRCWCSRECQHCPDYCDC